MPSQYFSERSFLNEVALTPKCTQARKNPSQPLE